MSVHGYLSAFEGHGPLLLHQCRNLARILQACVRNSQTRDSKDQTYTSGTPAVHSVKTHATTGTSIKQIAAMPLRHAHSWHKLYDFVQLRYIKVLEEEEFGNVTSRMYDLLCQRISTQGLQSGAPHVSDAKHIARVPSSETPRHSVLALCLQSHSTNCEPQNKRLHAAQNKSVHAAAVE